MADSWRGQESRTNQLAHAQQSMTPGTVSGRVRQAAPLPRRTRNTAVVPDILWVDDTAPDPDVFDGPFWFNTNG